jgi:cysteinyl-tRNA synthetase
MTIKVYNTLGRCKQPLDPMTPGKIRMYVCGPTVYDSCHIGHARSIVVFDVIYRYLKARGYDVYYVRNFTDVDDKIIQRANDLGISSTELAGRCIDEFHADMESLNMQPPDLEPLATDHISQIITIVRILIEKGNAYPVDGDVYFAVEKWPEYGKLSGRKLEDMEAGARVDVDPRKHSPFDFVLWKASKPGEPAWDSPWGKGRPGWHIECSAMSAEYLGQSFDIHGGGKDLIFPHHENEIAQSEAAFGKPFARYWIHNGFININQEKMSKSLGNFLMIKDIVRAWHPEVLRLFLVSNHYRSPIDYMEQAMAEAAASLDKIYGLLERVAPVFDAWPPQVSGDSGTELWQRFCEAMDDDFNTARGMGLLFKRLPDGDQLKSFPTFQAHGIMGVAVQFDDLVIRNPGLLMEPVDVLGDHAGGFVALHQFGHGQVAGIGPGLVQDFAQGKPAAPGFNARFFRRNKVLEIDGLVLAPDAARASEIRDPGLRADAGAGKHYHPLALIQHLPQLIGLLFSGIHDRLRLCLHANFSTGKIISMIGRAVQFFPYDLTDNRFIQ